MEIFKRRILFFVLLCFLCFSCSEEESVQVASESEKVTLSFAPILNDLLRSQENSKQEAPELPACSDDTPSYVEIVLLQGEEEVVGSADSPFAVNLVSGENFTEYDSELELEAGTYTLDHFAVYNSEGGLLWLSPRGGAMGDLVANALPLQINLISGSKKYVDVPVVCFDDRLVNEYGYLFFDLIPSEIFEFCFFANYCNESGRHFPAAFSVDIWLGTDDSGTPLYSGLENVLHTEFEDPSADPLCINLPNLQQYGDDEDYIYYEVTLLDWPEVYAATSSTVIEGTLSRADIEANFDGDNNVEYEHLMFGCDDGDSNGGGTGGNLGDNYFTIQNSLFNDQAMPNANSELLEILEIRGNSNILAGGSNLIEIIASGNTTELIVGVQGQEGYYTVAMDEVGDNSSSFIDLLLLLSQRAEDSFTIVFIPSDGQGNFGQFETLQVTRQEGGTGLLQISLSWDQPNDVDLHLIQPDGQKIYYGNPTSTNGGELDVDSNAACSIDGINNENIYYADIETVTVQNGEYEVLVDLWSNCNVSGNTNYNVVVYYDGSPIVPTGGTNPFAGELTPADESRNTNLKSVMTFDIQNGAITRSRERKTSENYRNSDSKIIYKFDYDKDNKVFENFNPKKD